MSVSVCVIGRNEAENLERLMHSLRPIRQAIPDAEILYVDSHSMDESVQIALEGADEVLVLEDSPNLCASAGRYVGTLRAQGTWILYLDADMELDPSFVPFLVHLKNRDDRSSGWIGERTDIYSTGSARTNVLEMRDSGAVVPHFGGGVVLPREAVLRAGNWNPAIYSNEEIDLYTRLRTSGCVVRSAGVPMFDHHTREMTRLKKLRDAFLPGGPLGKKYYGMGQVMASKRSASELASFVRFNPMPFVFWSSIGFGSLLLALRRRRLAVLTFASGGALVWRAKGFRFIATYAAFGPQVAAGYRRYDADYVPIVAETHVRS